MRPLWTFTAMAVCLVTGAIVSVVVALSCHLWMPLSGAGSPQHPTENDVRVWKTRAPKGVDGPPQLAFASAGLGVKRTLFLSGSTDPGGSSDDHWMVVRAGLPVPCLQAIVWTDQDGRAIRADGAYSLARPVWGSRRAWVPIGVAWSGLAINTASFGLVALLLWHAARVIRARRRRARGLCAACAHPLVTSGACAECGTPSSGTNLSA